MNIFDKFSSKANQKTASIGIGLGDNIAHNLKILKTSVEFLSANKSVITLFGNEKAITEIEMNTSFRSSNSRILLNSSSQPEIKIISALRDSKIDSIVRGSISSNKFLKSLKDILSISEINRLALLETFNEYQFFFGPVGIDECVNKQEKISYIKAALNTLRSLDIPPKISLLSGGRSSDIGRDPNVDKIINTTKEILSYFEDSNENLKITNNEILIEDAIKDKSNIIIAPDGVSGNLIYRTLVHLGGGKAYGAIYMGLPYVIIDTSRVGKSSEIKGALILACVLAKNKWE